MPAISSATRSYVIKLALLSAAYASVVYLSLFLVPPGGSGASLAWPPSVIALAALFFYGLELWPALVVPFFLLLLAQGIEPPTAAAVALANTLEAYVGVKVLQYFNFDPMFNRLQDAMVLALAAFVSTVPLAIIITLAVDMFRSGVFNLQLLAGLWIGHAISIISLAPFVLRWGCRPFFTRTIPLWMEGIIGFGSLAVLSYFASWTPHSSVASVPLLYLIVIALIWAALRTGPRGMALGLFMMAAIFVSGVLFSHTVDAERTAQALFSFQLVTGVLSLIFILFVSIVEERKEANRILRERTDALEEALERVRNEDQAKSDFIAILAHELRNPLSPMLSGLELLKIESKGPPEVLHMMGAHLNTVARLLDDLLDLSRISQKKFKLQKEPVKLADVIGQSLEMVGPHMSERNHSMVTVLPEEELWVEGDPVRLSQVFVNLLTNAAKYTDPGGRVRLEARRAGNEALIEVSDSGIGIAPERMRKIFEAFGATDPGASRMGGLHIGLSLAKRMTELHQGSLEAHSLGMGQGSRFTVRLPIMPIVPMLTGSSKRSRGRFSKAAIEESRQGASLEILVVDDNEAAADSLSLLLTHTGHRPITAYDAQQALMVCENREPDVALLDIGLPGMDGYELCSRLRAQFDDDIFLVALTGYGQSEDKEKARNAGFDEHLTKPVSIVDVERVLADLRR